MSYAGYYKQGEGIKDLGKGIFSEGKIVDH